MLSSPAVCDIVVNNQATKNGLKACDIFGENCPGKIHIRELLSSDVYNLLRETKVRARTLEYKFVWYRNGSIYIRKSEGTPRITINNVEDLTNLS